MVSTIYIHKHFLKYVMVHAWHQPVTDAYRPFFKFSTIIIETKITWLELGLISRIHKFPIPLTFKTFLVYSRENWQMWNFKTVIWGVQCLINSGRSDHKCFKWLYAKLGSLASTKTLLFSETLRLRDGKCEHISNRLTDKPLHLTPFHSIHGRAAGSTALNYSCSKSLWVWDVSKRLTFISSYYSQFINERFLEYKSSPLYRPFVLWAHVRTTGR